MLAGWVVIGVYLVYSAVDLAASGWRPVVDNAVIAAMSIDSISLDPPLVGAPTSAGLEGGDTLSHAGPLGLWILAVPAKLLGEPGYGLLMGACLIALVSLSSIAVVLRRQGDTLVEALGLVTVAAMVMTLGGARFASPYNPDIGILPLLLFLLAAWRVVAGDHGPLWVVVLAGSLAAQTHLGYVPVVAGGVALISASLIVDVVRNRDSERLLRRTIPLAVILGLLAWVGPILDQLFGSQNLERLVRDQSGDRTGAGLDHGVDLAVEMTSVPPRWLMGRARDQDLSDPATVRVVLSLAAVGVVVGLMVWAFRRRDRAFTALAATSLVGITAATFSAARITEPAARQFLAAESMLLYRLYWWPVGAVFVLAITWGNTRIVSAVVRGRVEVVQRWRPAMVPALAVLVAAVGLVMVVSYKGSNDLLEPYYKQQEPNAEAIAELPGSPGEVVIRFAPESDPLEAAAPRERLDEPQDGPHGRYSRAANLLAQLRLRGIAVRFADEADDGYLYLRPYRNEHPAEGDEPVEVLLLAGPGAQDPPPDGYRRISASGEASAGSLLTPTGVYVLSSP